jgi:plastocyanin
MLHTAALASATLLLFALAGCSDDGGDDHEHFGTETVFMHNSAFSPASKTVRAGTDVVWENHDTVVHTATANNGAFDTRDVAANSESTAVHFETPGTYQYKCLKHPSMMGTIIVTE